MKKLLFISFHRIGVAVPDRMQTQCFDITVEQQVSKQGYVDELALRLSSYDQVVAYAGLDEFEDLSRLMCGNSSRLRLCACDCNEQDRLEILGKLGLRQTDVYWTRGCGGSQLMATIIAYVQENEQLPDSILAN